MARKNLVCITSDKEENSGYTALLKVVNAIAKKRVEDAGGGRVNKRIWLHEFEDGLEGLGFELGKEYFYADAVDTGRRIAIQFNKAKTILQLQFEESGMTSPDAEAKVASFTGLDGSWKITEVPKISGTLADLEKALS